MAVSGGIAGSLGARRPRALEAMARALAHRFRGADRSLRDPRVAPIASLSFARSPAPDHASLWHPWRSPDDRILVGWDGEIHNRAACLAAIAGVEPADATDEALVAALYERLGIDGLGLIEGPFAVALADARSSCVVLGRDVLGVRPLHHTTVDNTCYFASEVQALLEVPGVERAPDFGAIAEQLSHLHLSGHDTFFEGISTVPPGHVVRISPDGVVARQRFRDLVFTDDGPVDEREAIDAFSSLLRTAVRRDLDASSSNVVALSGGIDSAAIAAIAVAEVGADLVRGEAIANDFDLVAGPRPPTDLPIAARCEGIRAAFLADRLGMSYMEHVVQGAAVLDAIPSVVEQFAAPHTSSYAPFLLAAHLGSATPHLLSGLGADELLRGYRRSHAIERSLGATVFSEACADAASGYFVIDQHLTALERHAILHPDLRSVLDSDRIAPKTIEAMLRDAPVMRTPDACLYLDFKTQVANEYLATTDLSFGHRSIAVGLPFLDVALVDFVLSLPLELRSASPRPKHLLREAVRDLLPTGYLDLPKTGFALPINRWIDGPLRPWIDEMLNPHSVRARGWFSPTAVEALRSRHDRRVDHRSDAIWTLAMIETWARHCVDRASAPDRAPARLEIPAGPTIVGVSAELGSERCAKDTACLDRHMGQHRPLVGDYVGVEVPFVGQTVASWIDLRTLTFDDYVTSVRRTHKGGGLRHAAKADRAGYICERFAYDLHVPDIADVNHSKPERSAGPMTERYRRTVEELGGEPSGFARPEPPVCPLHHDTWWGIFLPEPGHRQGPVVVDRRLVGYIRVRRHGNYALLSKILGHGEHLDRGVMYRLLLAVMEWLCARAEPSTQGIDHLVYANDEHLPAGLRQWKRKMQFRPALLVEPPGRARTRTAPVPAGAPPPAYVPLGENCLADDVVRRHGLDPVINPYSYGRTNLDYALELESQGYDRLLDRRHLVAATSGAEAVVRNEAILACDPIYHPRHDLGFEFTHHDVIDSEADRASLARKVQRLHDIRGRRAAWFFYHHRIHDRADLAAVVAKAERFIDYYRVPTDDSRFIVFTQRIVEATGQRGLDRVDHTDRVVSFTMRSLQPWEGDDDDVFWGRPDDDLFREMFRSLGLLTETGTAATHVAE